MLSTRSLLLLSPLVARALAYGNYTWQAPSATDLRSPCPMVNTLANHGYLPRDGLNVSLANLVTAFSDAINLDEAATLLVGTKALSTSTTGDNSTFNLDDLDEHDVLEHDGSLSRADLYFGDNHSFNETIYASFFSHFAGNATIDVATASQARLARLGEAEAVNPVFNISAELTVFSMIETALYLSVLSNGTWGVAVTEWVDVLFREERLPFEEGFTRSDDVITAASVLALEAEIASLSAL